MSIDTLLAERQSIHGDFLVFGGIRQELRRVMEKTPSWNSLTDAQREALDMIQHKVARILNGNPNFADHWTDIQGYARLIERELLMPVPPAAPHGRKKA